MCICLCCVLYVVVLVIECIYIIPVNAKHCGASLRKCQFFQSVHTCMLSHVIMCIHPLQSSLSLFIRLCKLVSPPGSYITAAGGPVFHLQALQLVSPAGSYVTSAGGPVFHLQFNWPLCFCRKHAS